MAKMMYKLTNNNGTAYFVGADTTAFDGLKEFGVTVTKYQINNLPFAELPEEIQIKAKSILKAYDKVNVVFENNKFSVSVGYCIKSSYARDHFVCGEYRADEIYTAEERRQNYFESFGYYPARVK